jgi:hypothetical protein
MDPSASSHLEKMLEYIQQEPPPLKPCKQQAYVLKAKQWVTTNKKCGACALTRAERVSHSERLRSIEMVRSVYKRQN